MSSQILPPESPAAPRQISSSARFLGRWWLLGLALIFVFVVRIRLLDVPLERDEGDHAYTAQLILQGIPPWKYSYNMKFPGTDAMYAVAIALFGQTIAGVHAGLLLANAATMVFIALIGRRLFGYAGGAAAGAAYGIFSLSEQVVPIAAHASHYAMLAATAGILVLIRAAAGFRKLPLFSAGFLLGLSVLMKQPGAVFPLFGFVILICCARGQRRGIVETVKSLLMFGTGAVLPLGLMCFGLWRAGVFAEFWFWTVTLAREFASILPLAVRIGWLEKNFPEIMLPNWPLWLFAAAGLVWPLFKASARSSGLFLLALVAFSFAATSAGGLYSPHYFIFLLPAVALSVGSAVAHLVEFRGTPTLALFVLACICCILGQRQFFFRMTPEQVSRDTYGLNPFPEAIEIARYIEAHSKKTDRVAVLGSESEICFYARRRSASGFLFMYSLTEASTHAEALQGQMIGEVEAARPEFLIFVNIRASWSWNGDPPASPAIFFWSDNYIKTYYKVAGVADIGQNRTEFRWDQAAQNYTPASPLFVMIYRRTAP